MANHPNRKRRDVTAEDERQLEVLEGMAADLTPGDTVVELGGGDQELRPAAPGDIPQGSAEMAAHNGNGVPPGLRPNAAKLIGQTVAAGLIEALPPILAQAVYSALVQALTQVPVQAITKQPMCGTCLLLRITWEQRNRPAMEKAIADACAAAGVEHGSPQAGQLDLTVFLPPELRPGTPGGMPPVQEKSTTVNGNDVCPMHIPGVQSGPLIVPVPALSGQALAQFARALSVS